MFLNIMGYEMHAYSSKGSWKIKQMLRGTDIIPTLNGDEFEHNLG